MEKTLAERLEHLVLHEYPHEPMTRAQQLEVLVLNNLDEILSALESNQRMREALLVALKYVCEMLFYPTDANLDNQQAVEDAIRSALAPRDQQGGV